MADCNYPDCHRAATHWVLRRLPEGYLPNPDARAYCDAHRVADLAAVVASSHAPVVSAEIVEIEPTARLGA
ncbi:MAG TPA: hypothetical protein VFL59_08205 [Candidatus Nanopelagicales bacterium]|nr:hypothetical protein [Candidatus Nanopelagicales bacterium]